MKKLDLITTVALTLMAISIALLDFSDLSLEKNLKSYLGLFFSVVLFIVGNVIRSGRKNSTWL